VLAFDSSTRDFYSTNNTAVIASFTDVLRAYDINGANGVDVHTTLTNINTIATGHVARVDNPHSVTAAQVGAVSNNAAGIAAAGGITTNEFTPQLTITYSNNMVYFNAPLGTVTGMVFNIGGSNILMKAVN
jgi:hypothetical protein